MEKLTLTEPIIVPQVTQTEWRIWSLYLGVGEQALVIALIGENGERRTERVEGAEAITILRALNTANGTVKSLHRRAMEWLMANRGYAATVNGAPD